MRRMASKMRNFLKTIKRYVIVWLMMSKNAFLVVLARKKLFFLFLLGKLLRFAFFLGFLFFLVSGSKEVAGYNIGQITFFFLTFNLIDILAQFFYREVYRFRVKVIRGELDMILTKPINALFRSMMGSSDIIDLVTIPPLMAAIYYVGSALNPSPANIGFYVLLVVNGFLIATAFHIAVMAMGIITLEIDHTIMIYRDLTNLGRFPVDIYREPLRGILTFLVPVGIMVTLPAKALMGLVGFWGVFGSLVLGLVLMFLSIRFWNYALQYYTSASS